MELVRHGLTDANELMALHALLADPSLTDDYMIGSVRSGSQQAVEISPTGEKRLTTRALARLGLQSGADLEDFVKAVAKWSGSAPPLPEFLKQELGSKFQSKEVLNWMGPQLRHMQELVLQEAAFLSATFEILVAVAAAVAPEAGGSLGATLSKTSKGWFQLYFQHLHLEAAKVVVKNKLNEVGVGWDNNCPGTVTEHRQQVWADFANPDVQFAGHDLMAPEAAANLLGHLRFHQAPLEQPLPCNFLGANKQKQAHFFLNYDLLPFLSNASGDMPSETVVVDLRLVTSSNFINAFSAEIDRELREGSLKSVSGEKLIHSLGLAANKLPNSAVAEVAFEVSVRTFSSRCIKHGWSGS